MQVLLFGAYHTLVVYSRECVEFLSKRFKLSLLLCVCQRRQLSEIDIYRIERKDADARIWIGVGPSARRGSIVDGQQLQHSLAGVCHEVGHCGKVAEVAYAETAFGAQREERHECSSQTSVAHGEERLVLLYHAHVACLHRIEFELTVVARLPHHIAVGADCHKLVFNAAHRCCLSILLGRLRHTESVGVEVDLPFIVVMLVHRNGVSGVPCSQRGMLAYDGKPLAQSQLRRTHYQTHRAAVC